MRRQRLPAAAICVWVAIGSLLGWGSPPASAGLSDLRVNEFMAANRATILDEAGEAADWVELFNTGSTPVNVEGMFLSDTRLDTQKWEFPDTIIPARGYLIIWCDGEPAEGPLHATFSLDADGEFIGLYEYLGIGNDVVDSTSFGPQAQDVSYGRYPNGAGAYAYLRSPTPAAANTPPGNVPPFFEDTAHQPGVPDDGEPVAIVTRIADDSAILEARVYYDAGAGFLHSPLLDDGAHGDGAAADGLFGGQIPGYPRYTQVRYYVWARDDSAAVGTDPLLAPDETFSYVVAYTPPALYINEFMAQNNTTITDDYGEYEDWVEIYNRSDSSVNIGGMYLSDDPGNAHQFALPNLDLPARSFLIVWCDNDPEQGPLHANFRLGVGGEFIGLYDRGIYGVPPIDTLSFGPQTADVSFGRYPNAGADWVFYDSPTPGESNTGSAVEEPGLPRGPAILSLSTIVAREARVTFRLVEAGPLDLAVFDVCGRRVLAANHHAAAGSGELRLMTSSLPAGHYLLRLRSGGEECGARFLVVR